MSSTVHFRSNVRLQSTVLFVGLLLMGLKFLAWWLTNSNAILTDALESIINILAGAFGLFSLILAAKPRDRNHPYGHGKIEFVSAGFEGGLIMVAGVLIIGKSGYNLFVPQQLEQLDIGIFLVGGAGLVNFIMGWLLRLRGKKSRSLIMEASGKHLQSDAYSSAGLLIGLLVLFFTRIWWLDNAIAISFGLLILYTGLRLLRTSLAGIMDEADYGLIGELVEAMRDQQHPNWIDVHNFRIIKYGSTLHVDCHLTVPYYFDVLQAHDEIKDFETVVARNSEAPVELFIHTDPCRPPRSCTVCRKMDCAVRQAPQEPSFQWDMDNFLSLQQHYAESDKSQQGN